jgi:peptide/nickel transport system ATP-binding protein
VTTAAMLQPAPPLVQVRDLNVSFVSREATVRAVNGVSFELMPGEVLCIIGESGSGKSVTMRALMRLLPHKRAVVSGDIRVAEHDVLALDERRRRSRSSSSCEFRRPSAACTPIRMSCRAGCASVR